MNNITQVKRISKKDCFVDHSIITIPEYPNAVFCACGNTIHFKNRESFETVIIKCPCGKEIMYG